jgi:hypothetical protein
VTALVVTPFALPWDTGRADRQVLRRWLTILLAIVTIAGTVIPWLPMPEVERAELEALPPQLARFVAAKPEPVPPPPTPEPVMRQETPEPAVEKPVAKVEQPPKPKAADAREKAAVSGLLQFKDAFADMREAVDVSKLRDTAALQRGSGEAASIDRALLTSAHGTRSAGVNVAAPANAGGGVALAGRETTRVEAPEASAGEGGVRANDAARDPRSRSIEEIRRVFDANKGAIFAIYNRALRDDPTLKGKLLLELVITPSGAVEDCRVVATELADPNLVARLVTRIRLFDFGKRDVATTTISYPVHFLPV